MQRGVPDAGPARACTPRRGSYHAARTGKEASRPAEGPALQRGRGRLPTCSLRCHLAAAQRLPLPPKAGRRCRRSRRQRPPAGSPAAALAAPHAAGQAAPRPAARAACQRRGAGGPAGAACQRRGRLGAARHLWRRTPAGVCRPRWPGCLPPCRLAADQHNLTAACRWGCQQGTQAAAPPAPVPSAAAAEAAEAAAAAGAAGDGAAPAQVLGGTKAVLPTAVARPPAAARCSAARACRACFLGGMSGPALLATGGPAVA